jgi:hypothetical protein
MVHFFSIGRVAPICHCDKPINLNQRTGHALVLCTVVYTNLRRLEFRSFSTKTAGGLTPDKGIQKRFSAVAVRIIDDGSSREARWCSPLATKKVCVDISLLGHPCRDATDSRAYICMDVELSIVTEMRFPIVAIQMYQF